MDIGILATLVHRVTENHSEPEQVLSAEESLSFQNCFSSGITKQLEEIRLEKTRVLEEYKNLAVR
ncbi:MAG: hypothetical protein ABJQ78_09065 [Alloalcanivorax sp.]